MRRAQNSIRFQLIALPNLIAPKFAREDAGNRGSGFNTRARIHNEGARAARQDVFDRAGHFFSHGAYHEFFFGARFGRAFMNRNFSRRARSRRKPADLGGAINRFLGHPAIGGPLTACDSQKL